MYIYIYTYIYASIICICCFRVRLRFEIVRVAIVRPPNGEGLELGGGRVVLGEVCSLRRPSWIGGAVVVREGSPTLFFILFSNAPPNEEAHQRNRFEHTCNHKRIPQVASRRLHQRLHASQLNSFFQLHRCTHAPYTSMQLLNRGSSSSTIGVVLVHESSPFSSGGMLLLGILQLLTRRPNCMRPRPPN